MDNELIEKLEAYGQKHIINLLDKMNDNEKEELINQLERNRPRSNYGIIWQHKKRNRN